KGVRTDRTPPKVDRRNSFYQLLSWPNFTQLLKGKSTTSGFVDHTRKAAIPQTIPFLMWRRPKPTGSFREIQTRPKQLEWGALPSKYDAR
ncbi:hypothetical protein, partial [Devosia sp. Leaf64]|uniref:hypothetical protein n=1 Tax=Devosia sp. Leaf64 TaxID=1736229 RepID=UPI001AEBF653